MNIFQLYNDVYMDGYIHNVDFILYKWLNILRIQKKKINVIEYIRKHFAV